MPLDATATILEQIIDTMKARLCTLVPDPIVEVIRPLRLASYTPKHLQIVLTQTDPEEVEELMRPGNPPGIGWEVTLNVRVHLMPSEKDPVSIDEYINRATGVVQKAIAPSVGWQTFGGLAINAQFAGREMIDADGGFDGINLPVIVTYRTSELDPYVSRA